MGGSKPTGSETQVEWVTPAPAPTRDTGPIRIADRYAIEAQLGVGGMGAVYRVRDEKLDEVVALKMVRPELARRPGLLDRFRQEVKLARRVTHPNVVRTFDLGETVGPDGQPRMFLTMEFVDGPSLTRLLADQGPMSPARALPIVTGICAGLQAAHDARVLHRDLKPDNVLVDAGGRAVLTDFGISRALAQQDALAQTVVGAVIGTPAYMAPEQTRRGASADHRADLYALGAILFELLTGRRAWDGDDPLELAVARATEPPPDPRGVRSDLPDEVAQVVLRCLSRLPEDRYPSAHAVALAFAAAAHAAPTAAPLPAAPVGVPFERASTLAVLPFRTSSPDDLPIGEGLAEELADAFSMTRGLRVRPLGAHREAASTGDARDLGRQLDVEVVVEGSIRRLGERYKVTVRAVNVCDGFQVGAWRFESADPLSIADDAAATVARALTVDLSVPARASSDRAATELYLRGKQALRASWYQPDLALPYLEQAHALSPSDPTILGEYATAVARAALFGKGAYHETLARALALAERAVALGPDRPEPWFALATAHFGANDLMRAVPAWRAVLERAPGHTQAQESLAGVLLEADAIDEAMVRLKAVSAADPSNARPWIELTRAWALLGDWDRAQRMFEATPENPGRYMIWARLRLWNPDLPDATPLTALPGADTRVPMHRLPGVVAAGLGKVHAERRADPAEIEQVLFTAHTEAGRLLVTRHQVVTEVYAFVGDLERAAHHLVQAVDKGLIDLAWMDRCPVLAALRADPRFAGQREVVAARAQALIAAAR